LTSHLDKKQSPVRQFIHTHFPNTRKMLTLCRQSLTNATTVLPTDVSYPWGLIGTALDYRIRYYFTATPVKDLIAYQGVQLIPIPEHPDREFWEAILPMVWPSIFNSYFAKLESDLQEIQPAQRKLPSSQEELLAHHCIMLALCEELYRSASRNNLLLTALYQGWTEHEELFLSLYRLCSKEKIPTAAELQPIMSKLLAIPQPSWISDLCTLSWQFYDRYHALLSQPAILNPTFDGSADVNGADADLIVNGCLIEIKTSKNPQVKSEWLYQLLGYTLLDYTDRYHLSEVAIYMARQGILLRWTLDEVLNLMADGVLPPLHELRSEFQSVTKPVGVPKRFRSS
ncbi:MAG TPA: hypothetical protein VGD69_20080, partial [Herpetosiphonaceae bacterium]